MSSIKLAHLINPADLIITANHLFGDNLITETFFRFVSKDPFSWYKIYTTPQLVIYGKKLHKLPW